MKYTFTVTYTLHGKTGWTTLHANDEEQAKSIVKAEYPGCRIVHVLDYNRY